jgi:hypothetical protein
MNTKLFKNIGSLVEGKSYQQFLIFKAGSSLGAGYAIYTLETENIPYYFNEDAPAMDSVEFQKGYTPEVTVEPLSQSILNQVPEDTSGLYRNGAFTKRQALEIVQYLEERWEGKPQKERELSYTVGRGGNKNLYWEKA